MGLGETARIETGLVGAGRALDPRGLRVLGCEQLRELRAKDRERRHAEKRGKMAGAGVVADESVRARKGVHELIEIVQRVVEHHNVPARGPQPRGDFGKAFDGPEAHGMAGAGMDDDAARRGGERGAAGCEGRKGPAEGGGEGAPVFGAMGKCGAGERLGQQQAGTGAGKSEATPGSGPGEEGMIAGIGAGGDTKIKVSGAQCALYAEEFAPRPAMEAVFTAEGGPGRGERHEFNFRREAGEERRGVRFRQQGDARVRGGATQKGQGQGQVAETPELGDEQAGRSGVLRRFCQARGVKF